VRMPPMSMMQVISQGIAPPSSIITVKPVCK
jgi:hypothetical protein